MSPHTPTIRQQVAQLGRSASASASLAQWLAAIERENGRLNALLCVATEMSRQQASAIDQMAARFPEGLGPLAGIPISVKDLIDTSFLPTTYGHGRLREHVPNRTALCVTRLQQAHALIIGKAHLHEFAFGVTNENPHFGPARNPRDPERITGGSSGGSAASVAGGMVQASVGTDTGGSVRIPAALTGCVGFKPSHGVIPTDGVLPLAPTLDHVGSLAHSVEDAALVAAIMAGLPPDAWLSLPPLCGRLRAAVVPSLVSRFASPEVSSWFEALVRVLAERGTFEIAGTFELHPDEIAMHQGNIIGAEAYATHRSWLQTHRAAYGEDVRERLEDGARVDTASYAESLRFRTKFRNAVLEAFTQFDCILLPTTPIPAPRIGESTVTIRGETCAIRPLLTRFTNPWNLSGAPAISIPAGQVAGLPMGLQIVGKPGGDAELIRVARRIEEDIASHLP
ncbi:amidase [Alicyclobacillus vulcanalis]|uniref:Aspartyl-tRNA(Asn)/glutamyl-tRNA(Gln) amidotransferase subunit A n=1 Tax=Alicyclobacillus vulcanalis TaxID=252246 RepID=A0A1N7NRN4_9BACL|nr:amidase [Alicyclobacillus vulcanalis]SIT00994.1 aspartyl-tRNA(Asn)/glutamyl-tRNA(Gln) amidotransferase subunit A [Alicyclobacillus vulcanalis]